VVYSHRRGLQPQGLRDPMEPMGLMRLMGLSRGLNEGSDATELASLRWFGPCRTSPISPMSLIKPVAP
jgi:hypothetical protein